MGDLTAQMLLIADLADRYSQWQHSTTINQNMIIRWVPDRASPTSMPTYLHKGWPIPVPNVEDLLLSRHRHLWLGITSSKGSRERWQRYSRWRVPEDLKDVIVKISGCHNSCASTISPRLACMEWERIGEHVAPFYELHLGGGQRTAKIGQMCQCCGQERCQRRSRT